MNPQNDNIEEGYSQDLLETNSSYRVFGLRYDLPPVINIGIRRETIEDLATFNMPLPPITINDVHVQFASLRYEVRDDLSLLESKMNSIQETLEDLVNKFNLNELARHFGNELVGESYLR
jgi:hypothetical protein